MPATLIDLSMSVDNGMVTFPRVAKPKLHMHETWQEFAEGIGAAQYGATWLTATCTVELNDHAGTHLDSLRHMNDDAGGAQTIPLEFCYGDVVVLDFRQKAKGAATSGHDHRDE